MNHHQLLCFRVIAREGSLSRASAVLRVSPQTLSEHVQQLESSLGATLFVRGARGMSLTDAGREALGFAEKIHAMGQELLDALDGRSSSQAASLRVGVDESLPKSLAWSLLAPAAPHAMLSVREGGHDDLVTLLRARSLDVVLSESPAPSDDASLRCAMLREHQLGWFAAAESVAALRRDLPASLLRAPIVLAAPGSALRDAAERWFARHDTRPSVVAEFSDTALAKPACAEGLGVMVLPRAMSGHAASIGLGLVADCEGVTQSVFLLTTTAREAHPGVVAIRRRSEAAEGIS